VTLFLDHQQTMAVSHPGHLLLSACPGSGKTRVLSSRAARLLSDSRGRLVAVTFTRDSAGELRRRIVETCQVSPGRRLLTGTFHSLCLNQFSRAKMKVRVLSGGEQHTVLRRAWEKTPVAQILTFDEAQKGVETIKSSLDPPPAPDSPLGAMYRAYQESLALMGVFDFPDLLRESVRLMHSGDLRPLPADWMLVDEAQDMDEVQYAWIQCHADAGMQVTIVGDDDQSIYGWRWALGYDGMMRFRRDLGAEHLQLSTNYRCAPNIIQAAANMIASNKARVDKAIRPFKREQGRVELFKAADRIAESQMIFSAIREDPSERWAVLARTNRLLDLVELGLCAGEIPCRRVGGRKFWDAPEPAVFLALVRSLSKGDGVGELLALHWAGIPQSFLDAIPTGCGWQAAAAHLKGAEEALGKPGRKQVATLIQRRAEWVEAMRLGRVRLAISGIAGWLRSQEKDARKATIFTWCEEALNKMSGGVEQRIFSLTQNSRKEKDQADGVNVVLMTVHNSKGLEFPNVWIIAAEEGILPHSDSAVEEERRLMYVGMTRAERRLVLSHTTTDAKPSRFLSEAGLQPKF